MSRIVLMGIASLLLLAPRTLHAVTVQVPPGNGTLQAAIDAAVGQTTFELSSGTYSGPVSITKPYLTIRSHSGTSAVINAGCTAPVALNVAADHFRMKGVASDDYFPLSVAGGTDREIVVAGSSRVTLSRVLADESCGTEPYGLEVNGSDHVLLNRVAIDNYSMPNVPAAEFVNIAPNAAVTVRKLFVSSGVLLVRDSGGPALNVGPLLSKLDVWSLQLVNSSGLELLRGVFGHDITIDSTSNDNDFIGCILERSGGWTDNGTGNCGARNTADIPVPPCS